MEFKRRRLLFGITYIVVTYFVTYVVTKIFFFPTQRTYEYYFLCFAQFVTLTFVNGVVYDYNW